MQSAFLMRVIAVRPESELAQRLWAQSVAAQRNFQRALQARRFSIDAVASNPTVAAPTPQRAAQRIVPTDAADRRDVSAGRCVL